MLVSIQDIKVGQSFQHRNIFLMKTNIPHENGVYCINKKGYYGVMQLDEMVETAIPWREQPDGYEVLYNYIKNLFPIKPQEIYDLVKEK